MLIEVRSRSNTGVIVIRREPVRHVGWESVRYQGKRFQLFGGIRGPLFIDLSNPLPRSGHSGKFIPTFKTKE
jgi:hypothetical protein